MEENYPKISDVDEKAIKAFVRLMAQEKYFESHEVLEEVWLKIPKESPARDFYKGLIQAAAALYLLQGRSRSGSLRLLNSSFKYLKPYQFNALGLNLIDLRNLIIKNKEANLIYAK